MVTETCIVACCCNFGGWVWTLINRWMIDQFVTYIILCIWRADLVQWWELSHWVTRSWVRSSLSADLRGEGLPRFFPSPDPTHVGASGTGSALFIRNCEAPSCYAYKHASFMKAQSSGFGFCWFKVQYVYSNKTVHEHAKLQTMPVLRPPSTLHPQNILFFLSVA